MIQALTFDADGVDSVIHVASLIPFLGVPEEAIWAINVDGTKCLLEACKSIPKPVKSLIYTSSATVVLDKDIKSYESIAENKVGYPKQHMDTYTTTKEAAELLVIAANNIGSNAVDGFATCVLRPAAVFGKGDKLVSDKHVAGIDAAIIGEGTAKIDWVPVESVALAHQLAEAALATSEGRKKLNGQVYFIGNNEQHQYGWFNGEKSSTDASKNNNNQEFSHWEQKQPDHIPLWLAYSLAYINITIFNLIGIPPLAPFLAPSLLDYTQRTYTFNSNKAFVDFGYKPVYSVEEAIRRRVEVYKKDKK